MCGRSLTFRSLLTTLSIDFLFLSAELASASIFPSFICTEFFDLESREEKKLGVVVGERPVKGVMVVPVVVVVEVMCLLLYSDSSRMTSSIESCSAWPFISWRFLSSSTLTLLLLLLLSPSPFPFPIGANTSTQWRLYLSTILSPTRFTCAERSTRARVG